MVYINRKKTVTHIYIYIYIYIEREIEREREREKRVKEKSSIPHTIKERESNGIGYIWRRNCLLKHIIEGKIAERVEVTVRRGRRRKQLLDDIKETGGYWKLK